jgi:hypothetical protein
MNLESRTSDGRTWNISSYHDDKYGIISINLVHSCSFPAATKQAEMTALVSWDCYEIKRDICARVVYNKNPVTMSYCWDDSVC